ncbi:uncharacterized protein LOC116306633 isoform X2 [Actinia tenebrosa]|uniref:Uncharacterized protein LOC116306633 isoform X2 n=1 Tax=Actinia tenebrosa TaxID=6105 RepID=A0A6P8IZE8_ACTTE|nr:uncharacterized protein LOC116306633 isoform X2 [Actinia tenebrosa]
MTSSIDANCSSLKNITANITCDNTLRVFVDGQQIGLESQGYGTVTKYVIPPNSNVIGLRCRIGATKNGGILGSFSNGLITNSSWRCSAVAEQGWNVAGFDDSSWDHATMHSINSHHNGSLSMPRGPVFDIADGAAWIWTANKSIDISTVYCRFQIRKPETPCKEGPNADLFRSEITYVDRSLKGSVLMTTKARSSIECALRCQRTSQCMSFNFEYGKEISPKICELNSGSAKMTPNAIVERKGFVYFDAIQ